MRSRLTATLLFLTLAHPYSSARCKSSVTPNQRGLAGHVPFITLTLGPRTHNMYFIDCPHFEFHHSACLPVDAAIHELEIVIPRPFSRLSNVPADNRRLPTWPRSVRPIQRPPRFHQLQKTEFSSHKMTTHIISKRRNSPAVRTPHN